MSEAYLCIIKEVKQLLEIDTTDIRLLIDRLNRLERIKYEITNYLITFERKLLGSNLEMLENMLGEGKKYAKVLSSSTLTKDVLNAKSLDVYARYKKMQAYLTNIRGTITSTITMISLEKQLAGMSNYGG